MPRDDAEGRDRKTGIRLVLPMQEAPMASVDAPDPNRSNVLVRAVAILGVPELRQGRDAVPWARMELGRVRHDRHDGAGKGGCVLRVQPAGARFYFGRQTRDRFDPEFVLNHIDKIQRSDLKRLLGEACHVIARHRGHIKDIKDASSDLARVCNRDIL